VTTSRAGGASRYGARVRVLGVSMPLGGHVSPLVPIIQALVTGGDEVVVATGAEVAPIVERSGARLAKAGSEIGAAFERLAQRTRGNPGDGIAPERINHYFVPRLFGEIVVDDMIDDVLAAGRDLQPDLVLFEGYSLAGPLAAELLGVPGVTHMVGPLLDPEIFDLANDAVSPIWRMFGRDVPGAAGLHRDITLQVCPPSLDRRPLPSGRSLAMRPVPLPATPPVASSRPMVHVTFGTFFSTNLEPFRVVLDALDGEPIDVVVTVGEQQDPAGLAPFPANARVERFIPQAALLPSAAVVVHHGGAGTTFGALAHGLPQLVIPQGADNFEHAAMCEAAGTSLTLRPGGVDPAAITRAVRRLLDEPSFAVASQRVAAEIAVMPGPAEVAATLRTLVTR
jgi:UDP:flavonoid glycosyltransferase YjiC (YdhE family)